MAKTAIVVLALLVLHGHARALSAVEQRIAAHVDAHNDEAIALLERVVNIDSPKGAFGGETCLENDLPIAEYYPGTPPLGDGYYYLARGSEPASVRA